jgi:hypothetical protein
MQCARHLTTCGGQGVQLSGSRQSSGLLVSPDPTFRPTSLSTCGLPLSLIESFVPGPDAAFHWLGLGLLPYKDTFISNVTSTQKSGRSWSKNPSNWPSFAGYHETGASTHALMALLSMAHVTFSDAVGESNGTLIRQLIRSDGMLLKADRPATAIDAQFQAMLFGAWPGERAGPAGKPGSLFTMPCDPHNVQQQWRQQCDERGTCGLQLGSTAAGTNCLAAVGPCTGPPKLDSELLITDAVGSGGVCGSDCPTQNWLLAENTAGPRGMKQYAVQSASNGTNREKMCLQLVNGGARLQQCDTAVKSQGFLQARLGRKLPGIFALTTTWHDDAQCLTAASLTQASSPNGAFMFGSEAEKMDLAEALFPRSGVDAAPSPLSAQYRDAYTVSAGLMQKIQTRQAQANAQCEGKLGAPQGPLGEIYSTHATVSGMTWHYVVGVQLSSNYNVSTHDLAIPTTSPSSGGGVQHVSYEYDHAAPGFSPSTAADVRPVVAPHVLELQANMNELCATSPDFGVKTRCFPFQLHAVAPVASNGWTLLGEASKFIPVSNQRLSSVKALVHGGFELGLKGGKGEKVQFGAIDVRGGAKTPVFKTATIGTSGTATLQLH